MVEIDKKIIKAYALKNHCIGSEFKFAIFAKVNLIKNNRLN